MKKKSESKCIYVRKRIFYQKGLHVCVCVDVCVCVCVCVWVYVCVGVFGYERFEMKT